MRLIAGDVGGTKTLLRCVEGDGAVSLDARYENGEWATFDALIGHFLAGLPGAADVACFAIAGPVLGDRATVTNLGWMIDASSLPIARVSLINDFHAVALGVPFLGAGDLVSLNRGMRVPLAPIAILGAGTGLGEAFIIGGEVVATEGGHADFAPQDEEQAELFRFLHARHGHVSWERVVSGMGLANIFTFLGGEEIDASEIALRADRGDPRAQHAFAMFVDMYGAEAGNTALKVLALGGVYLAGGIVAKNVARFTDGKFVEAFVRKGRFRKLMEGIPVDLVVNEEVGLVGAVEEARRNA